MTTIYTFGYIGATPADLLAHVDRLGATVVDIRSQPWSRNPEWTGTAIRNLVGVGRYRLVREFGNLNYKSGGPIQIADPERGLLNVRGVLAREPVILLCACRTPETCHRSVVAGLLAERLRLPVEHLPAFAAPVGSMKALSILQPWTSLIVIGAKQYETRSWETDYRGPLALHASKAFTREYRLLCKDQPFLRALTGAGYTAGSELPLGSVIATCDLVDCVPTESIANRIGDDEWAFGDWSPGRYAWKLDNIRRLAEPIPARGMLNLWPWTVPAEGLRYATAD